MSSCSYRNKYWATFGQLLKRLPGGNSQSQGDTFKAESKASNLQEGGMSSLNCVLYMLSLRYSIIQPLAWVYSGL